MLLSLESRILVQKTADVNTLSKLSLVAGIIAFAGCDDGSPADGDIADTTPPTLEDVVAFDWSHLEVRFNEDVNRETAEYAKNYLIIGEETIPVGSDTIRVDSAALRPDKRTVFLTAGGTMAEPDYDLRVIGVRDASGNQIRKAAVVNFTSAHNFDYLPPDIVRIDPPPGATGVGIGQSVVIRFSEVTDVDQFEWASAGGSVRFLANMHGLNHILRALEPLSLGTEYTIRMSGVHDRSFNDAPDTLWTFTTTSLADQTPITLVSSVPADLTTNVASHTHLSLTFSEAVDRASAWIAVDPDPGDSLATWSNDGRTLTLDPVLPLLANQHYAITIAPGHVTDLAGNGIELVSIRFTTSGALATGSIAGKITGDATSDYAYDPSGATVVASENYLLYFSSYDAAGADEVTANHAYSVDHLSNGSYFLIAFLNTNGDDWFNPELGDAFGAYGVDVEIGDREADSVTIAGGGQVSAVDFTLHDPSAAWGWIDYEGRYVDEELPIYIGLYDTTAFDPQSPPDVTTYAYWPDGIYWIVSTMYGSLLDGTYFAGAFLDVNRNTTFDVGIEPVGFYGGESPTPIGLEKGGDGLDLVVELRDPPLTATASTAVTWPRPVPDAQTLKRGAALVRRVSTTRKR